MSSRLGDRLASRLSPRALALLDVLIGMAIFALIAVIAVIAVGQFRQRAYVTGAISDARSLGLSIESAATQNGTFPSTVVADGTGDRAVTATVAAVAKKLGVITPGNRVGGYAYLPATAEDGSGFRICVEHVENGAVGSTGATTDAHAIYDSVAGGVIVSGDGDCDPAMAALPGASTDDGGDGDGDGDGDDPAVLGIPQNVTAVPVPDQPRADVSWDAVTGATSYAVFLDDATTPAWTGPELTAPLVSLPVGDHHVTVTARANAQESEPSEQADFTIFCNNDYLRCAHPVTVGSGGTAWTTADYNNTTATSETGEPALANAINGQWWTLTAPRDGTYTFRMVAPTTGTLIQYPSIDVWKTTTTNVTSLGTSLDSRRSVNNWVVPITAEAGETLKIRIGSYDTGTRPPGLYRLQVGASPENDFLARATEVTGLTHGTAWHSVDSNNFYAGTQPDEPATASSINGVWWTLTAPADGTYTFRAAATTTGAGPHQYPAIAVWKSTSTNVAALGTPLDSRTAINNWVVPISARAGETLKIRVGAYDRDTRPPGPFRLQIAMSPENDFLARAAPITPPALSTAWYSENANNFYAGSEPGEPHLANHINGLWWTMTATTAGTYSVRVAPTTDGAGPHNYPAIAIWKSTATDVSGLDPVPLASRQAINNQVVPITMAAGETIKIRIGAYDMNTRPPGRFRLQVNRTA